MHSAEGTDAALRSSWPPDHQPTMRIGGGGRGLYFHRALICHRRKRIVVANDDLRRLFSWSGGSRFGEPQSQKEEPKTSCWHATQREA